MHEDSDYFLTLQKIQKFFKIKKFKNLKSMAVSDTCEMWMRQCKSVEQMAFENPASYPKPCKINTSTVCVCVFVCVCLQLSQII